MQQRLGNTNSSSASKPVNDLSKKNVQSISVADYRRHARQRHNDRGRYEGRKELVWAGVLSHVTCLFLYDLISHDCATWTKKDGQDYFLCMEKYLVKSFAWTPRSQSKYLRELETKGLIRVKKSGTPPKRWIYIDYWQIEEEIGKHYETVNQPLWRSIERENGGLINTEEDKEDKGGMGSPAAGSPRPPLDEDGDDGNWAIGKPSIPKQCFDFADTLRDILRSRKPPIDVARSSRKKWADTFRKLIAGWGGDAQRAQTLLRWYKDAIHRLTRPSIRDAYQFRVHVQWLEDIMNKQLREEGKQPRIITTTRTVNGRVFRSSRKLEE